MCDEPGRATSLAVTCAIVMCATSLALNLYDFFTESRQSKSLMSSSETAEGVSTPRSVKSIVM